MQCTEQKNNYNNIIGIRVQFVFEDKVHDRAVTVTKSGSSSYTGDITRSSVVMLLCMHL